MNTDDYYELIALVETELREVGAGALSDPKLYALSDPDTGERRLFAPKKRLIEMLRAFDRHLAIGDRTTFDHALENINEVTKVGRVEDAVFIPLSEEEEGEPRSLRDAPDLGSVRKVINRLIKQLLEEQDPPKGTEY